MSVNFKFYMYEYFGKRFCPIFFLFDHMFETKPSQLIILVKDPGVESKSVWL